MNRIMDEIKDNTMAIMRNGSSIYFFRLKGKLCFRLGMSCCYFENNYFEDGTSKQNKNKDIVKVFLDGRDWERTDIDWNKIKMDDPVFVSCDGKTWTCANFAYRKEDRAYVFPFGRNSWTSINIASYAPHIKLPTKEDLKSKKKQFID